MSDIDWNRVHEVLYGYPALTPEPVTHAMFRAIQEGLYDAALAQGKAVVRQIVIEAHKAGIDKTYFQYLFFVLVQEQANWPGLSGRGKDALSTAVDLMVQSGALPNYRDGLQIPPVSEEPKITKTIQQLARWAQGPLAGALQTTYIKLVEKQQKPYLKAFPGTSPQQAYARLTRLFEADLYERPRNYTNPHLTQRIVRNLF